MKVTRRRFFGALGVTAATGLAGAAGSTRFIEPDWLEVTRVHVNSKCPGRHLRVLHLSDLHASEVVPFELIERAISLGLAERPDVIALTGDFVTGRHPLTPRYREALARLSAVAPTFACLGNHDGGAWAGSTGGYATTEPIRRLLSDAGIQLLHNTSRELQIGGRAVLVAGVGDLWTGECYPNLALREPNPDDTALRIVLNHNPDAKELFRPGTWDLMLCGHTHGGQLRLPLLGTPFAPVRDKRFVAGLHSWHDSHIYITRGVGNLHGVRFNCRPEVSLLDIA